VWGKGSTPKGWSASKDFLQGQGDAKGESCSSKRTNVKWRCLEWREKGVFELKRETKIRVTGINL